MPDNSSSWQRPQGRGNSRASGSNTPGNKDGGRQQAMSAHSGNAWKAKAAGSADRGQPQAQAQAQSTPPPADHHAVRDFNTAEVRDYLKKSMFPPCLATHLWHPR